MRLIATIRLPVTAAIIAPLLLAACATPREQCINRSTRELRNVSELLAEVDGNLARGYAWEEYQVERTRWRRCDRIARDDKGQTVVVPDMCLDDYTDTVRRRVAIDPALEQRKATGLRAKQAELTRKARAQVQACKAAYPEE
ncbi:hypothetical protein ACEYYB_13520 [Paracoccus sp. p4-l81]|uniref:hypothetical protein n=1 Tax=unclassified Paracoccus (in: a-proteobacteria) TaxID=2688777 RepID=UPI0035B952ED